MEVDKLNKCLAAIHDPSLCLQSKTSVFSVMANQLTT